MRRLPLFLCLLLLAPSARAAAFEPGAAARPGPHAVEAVLQIWDDPQRSRAVPVKLYVPAVTGEVPVILFSHGLGGSREAGAAWGRHWASHGFLAIHMQHPGSDESLWRGANGRDAIRHEMRKGMDPAQFVLRIEDVRFVLAELERRKRAGDAIARIADLRRVGMSGHSFGAVTTQAVAGERLARGDAFAVPEIRAAIAFSPSARGPEASLEKRFAGIHKPFFSITGTADEDVAGTGATPENRTLPYRYMPSPDKYLLVLAEATHATFGGAASGLRAPRTEHADAVRAGTLAFWMAYLEDDAKAREWLAGGAFARTLSGGDRFAAK